METIRRFVVSAWLSVVVLLFGVSASGAATYAYTGTPFTFVNPPYTLSDSVTGTLTFVSPLAANLNAFDVAASVIAFSFSDGVSTITNTSAAEHEFVVSTDPSGAIIGWNVAVGGGPPGSPFIVTCSAVGAGGLASFCATVLPMFFPGQLDVGTEFGTEVPHGGAALVGAWQLVSSCVVALGLFCGGDSGDGLDLDGTFVYAVNVGEPIGGLAVRDATFTIDTATSGFSITSATSGVPPFGGGAIPVYGSTTNDNNLETITREHRFSADGAFGDDLLIDMAVTAGQHYKLQLLMTDVWSPAGTGAVDRVFDVLVEGILIADDFNPTAVAGTWTTAPQGGAVITHSFTAGDGTLNIVLEDLEIQNPMLSALTLELVPSVVPSLSPLGTAMLWSLLGLAGWRRLRAYRSLREDSIPCSETSRRGHAT